MKPSEYKLRESLYKKLFLYLDYFNTAKNTFRFLALFVFILSTILFFYLLVYDFGFSNNWSESQFIDRNYVHLLTGLFTAKTLVEIFQINLKNRLLFFSKAAILFLILLVLSINYKLIIFSTPGLSSFFLSKYTLIFSSILLITTEIYQLSGLLNKVNLSPSLLFASSFLIIIIIGSGLLMVPNATTQPISYMKALFTSTSAVCVTGLVVVDTATVFTPIGKGIILFLIQIGGLGIMAFTGFFSYIFLGSATLKDRLVLSDVFSGEQMSGLFRMIAKILLITFLSEGIGALLIYHSLQGQWDNKLAASVFHSISAFCNAGFSTFTDGMASRTLRSNHFLQITISILVILGGLGFPVLLNFYDTLKYKIKNAFKKFTGGIKDPKVFPFVVGQQLAFKTALVLLVLGTFFYYLFEKNGTLQHMDIMGKVVTSFFGSSSARTAGFNIMDITRWTYPTVFVMIFLMWIGASPGSTGGGIKTTTFALAVGATYNYCRGRKYYEIGNREIDSSTLVRVLAILIVSILVIFISFLLLLIFDPGKNPTHLLFECVSAFSTVGLSMVNTATLSTNSKIVIILLMYIGRIGPVVLLSGILYSKVNRNYRLPVENIAIN